MSLRSRFQPAPLVHALAALSGLGVPLAATAQAAVPAAPLAAASSPAATPADAAPKPTSQPPVQQLDAITVIGNWLGTGLENSVKTFPGARTLLQRDDIQATGASTLGDVMRRIPGVQATENSGTAGSTISLNIGVRGLTGRYSPRSTVLLDGVPLAVAPYGQPQLSFSAASLANIDAIDVVRGAGAVRYGPQNVGGIINFKSRAIPSEPGVSGDASLRYNAFGEGGHNTQYSAFVGSSLDNGLGVALLYSGQRGSQWRDGSDDRLDDLAFKFRYAIGSSAEVYGKLSYFDVHSQTPGGLTVAQYEADPFQNTRPSDHWSGDRKGFDIGYLNTLSATQEVEVRAYYNDSFRQSVLVNAARTQLTHQPRHYRVLGLEPRYTQRFTLGTTSHDVTAGYRYLRETGNDNSFTETLASGTIGPTTTFDNRTTAHAVYVDDRIAIDRWRITPGVRFEHIESERDERASGQTFTTTNDKALPSLNVSYLLNDAATLFTGYGTSFGAVQNIQLNSQTADNPLKPELAKTVELGGRWKDTRLSAELTLFQIRFDNQIQQVPGVTPATFQNIGATRHRGIETAVAYAFDKAGPLAGFDVHANYTYTRAIQQSGATAGLDVPFYSRHTDTVGARYALGNISIGLSSTHQSGQYSDNNNTEAETATANVGRIPGFRTWNAVFGWKLPVARSLELQAGVNNLGDKRYYTRNIDGNAGRMVAAPRTVFAQARLAF
jgi:Fe(3+) dicitrate transport protein